MREGHQIPFCFYFEFDLVTSEEQQWVYSPGGICKESGLTFKGCSRCTQSLLFELLIQSTVVSMFRCH